MDVSITIGPESEYARSRSEGETLFLIQHPGPGKRLEIRIADLALVRTSQRLEDVELGIVGFARLLSPQIRQALGDAAFIRYDHARSTARVPSPSPAVRGLLGPLVDDVLKECQDEFDRVTTLALFQDLVVPATANLLFALAGLMLRDRVHYAVEREAWPDVGPPRELLGCFRSESSPDRPVGMLALSATPDRAWLVSKVAKGEWVERRDLRWALEGDPIYRKFRGLVSNVPRPRGSRQRPLSCAEYALLQGAGVWELVFRGERVSLKHWQGLRYIAALIYHAADRPMFATHLDVLAFPCKKGEALGELPTGETISDDNDDNSADDQIGSTTVWSDAQINELSIAKDDREIAREHRKQLRILDARIENPKTPERIREKARKDRAEAAEFMLDHMAPGAKDRGLKLARKIRTYIRRVCEALQKNAAKPGAPQADTLVAFASHIEEHILDASSLLNAKSRHGGMGLGGGWFVYSQPEGVTWTR